MCNLKFSQLKISGCTTAETRRFWQISRERVTENVYVSGLLGLRASLVRHIWAYPTD